MSFTIIITDMNSQMYGVTDGVYYCHLDRASELNERIAGRNVPSNPLQMQFTSRPVSTKYDLMSIVDRRPLPSVPIKTEPTYNIQHTFNPGTAQAPWSGFATNINDESKLRNQFFALQTAPQGKYIPSSTSDMYQVKVESGSPLSQPFPTLFTQPALTPFNPNICASVGSNLFDNCTRQQLKDVI